MFNSKKQMAEMEAIRKSIEALTSYVKELETKIDQMYKETHPKTMGGN